MPPVSRKVTAWALPGDGGAGPRPPEPRRVEGFPARVDRRREPVGRFDGLPDAVTGPEPNQAFPRAYAEEAAPGTGRVRGIRPDGTLVGAAGLRRTGPGGAPPRRVAGRGPAPRAARAVVDRAVGERGPGRGGGSRPAGSPHRRRPVARDEEEDVPGKSRPHRANGTTRRSGPSRSRAAGGPDRIPGDGRVSRVTADGGAGAVNSPRRGGLPSRNPW